MHLLRRVLSAVPAHADQRSRALKTSYLGWRKSLQRALLAGGITVVSATTFALIGWNILEFDRALFIYAQALILSIALTAYRFYPILPLCY